MLALWRVHGWEGGQHVFSDPGMGAGECLIRWLPAGRLEERAHDLEGEPMNDKKKRKPEVPPAHDPPPRKQPREAPPPAEEPEKLPPAREPETPAPAEEPEKLPPGKAPRKKT